MKIKALVTRNLKEILRDPISLIFCIGLPLLLLIVFQQFNIPSDVYEINNFAPGIVMFSFSFITLFTASLVARDKDTSLLTRLYCTPLKARDFIFSYVVAIIPIGLIQSLLFYLVALIFKFNFNMNTILSIIISIPIIILFALLGILIGSICSEKASPGVSSIVVQLVAFTSGMWFDPSMLSKGFQLITNILPFMYSLEIIKNTLQNNYQSFLTNYLILIVFLIIIFVLSTLLFKKNMVKK